MCTKIRITTRLLSPTPWRVWVLMETSTYLYLLLLWYFSSLAFRGALPCFFFWRHLFPKQYNLSVCGFVCCKLSRVLGWLGVTLVTVIMKCFLLYSEQCCRLPGTLPLLVFQILATSVMYWRYRVVRESASGRVLVHGVGSVSSRAKRFNCAL